MAVAVQQEAGRSRDAAAGVSRGVYERLGVRRIVNACGAITMYGGSLMPAEVVAAMAEASRSFVDLGELHQRAGEIVARHTGAEAGHVCAGAAAGLVLSTAACIAGDDPAKMRRLPDIAGMKHEVIIHKAHRNAYDHAFRQAGATLVEIGYASSTQPWELEAAIGPNTAAVAYVVAPFLNTRAVLSLESVIEIAHRHELPVIVDASNTLPPAENLTRFVQMGTDLVNFSGGKGLRGPQASGVLAGRRDLIRSAAMQDAPNHAIGRPMKVGKEEIVGLITALELYAARDHDADMADWRAQAELVVDAVSGIAGVECAVLQGDVAGEIRWVPQAVLRFTPRWAGLSTAQIVAALRSGDPPIYVAGHIPNQIAVNPHMLEPGEASLVGQRLAAALR
jgi:L-seryl-tRNA(Ser) seleniumtransferase